MSAQRRLTSALIAEAATVLASSDRKLAPWLDRVGPVSARRKPQPFAALCQSVLSQQLAAAAARTIHQRFLALFDGAPRPLPERLLEIPLPRLRACGISERKASYLRALAESFAGGELHGVRFSRLGDDEVIDILTRAPGIGRWTAEMFLIFSLGRPDVFSAGDLALRNGMQRVERRDDPISPNEAAAIAARWSPYRSVASLYLWKIAHWRESDQESATPRPPPSTRAAPCHPARRRQNRSMP